MPKPGEGRKFEGKKYTLMKIYRKKSDAVKRAKYLRKGWTPKAYDVRIIEFSNGYGLYYHMRYYPRKRGRVKK